MPFLTDEQQSLATEVAKLLTDRGDTIAVAESTTGGLVSAALLSMAGASRYYAGGGVLYTLNSRIVLAGSPPEMFENYRGTTREMLAAVGEGFRQKLDATWCIAESGLAGPTSGRSGLPPGRTTVSISGPVTRSAVFETGVSEREPNMVNFTTLTLRYLRDALIEAGA